MPVTRERVAKEMLGLADQQTEPSLKFFLQWAAFNALYRRTQRGKECTAIRKWAQQQARCHSQRMADGILRDPSAMFFAKRTIGAPFAECDATSDEADENRSALADSQKASGERLAALCLILYQVRNNLFHGSKSLTEPGDRRVLEEAAAALNVVLSTYLGPGSGF